MEATGLAEARLVAAYWALQVMDLACQVVVSLAVYCQDFLLVC
jgi:hypothetical protein